MCPRDELQKPHVIHVRNIRKDSRLTLNATRVAHVNLTGIAVAAGSYQCLRNSQRTRRPGPGGASKQPVPLCPQARHSGALGLAEQTICKLRSVLAVALSLCCELAERCHVTIAAILLE